MQLVKRSYAGFMHAVAGIAAFERLTADARTSDAFGLRRWAASLFAIHDVERMIALDLPWWNVAATREIDTFLRARPDARVFEYGAGASTVWLARRCAQVVAVEHHPAWHARLGTLTAHLSNVTLWHRDLAGGGYANAIDEADGVFDLVVIDGRLRTECLTPAVARLKPGGLVLFDDSGRRRYRAAIERCPLSERRYFGRSYCVPYPDHSSILHG